MSLKAIDDLLVKVQQNEPVEPLTAPDGERVWNVENKVDNVSDKVDKADVDDAPSEEKLTHLEQFRKDKEEYLAKQGEGTQEDGKADDLSHANKIDDNSHTDEVDDYGNKVPKSKTYTEEEVQAMIRKRLKLHHEERQTQEQRPTVQELRDKHLTNEEFQHEQSSEQPWEVQLESHIKQTVQKIETEKQQHAWQAEQQRAQADFEHRFTGGMAKYADFSEVVSGKPITNGIMMAARSMPDPAAFIYAAAKQQPKELERIAAITDPYVLAAEVGRLEERMKKARLVSKAPKPPTKTRGDIADKGNVRGNLDDLIRSDAKRKMSRR